MALNKLEGPTTLITFLCILLDTVAMELRLPQHLKGLIQQWQRKKSCCKRELLSLIGQLQHACQVIPPGRTFLRRMINLSSTAKELHHHIRLNAGFRSHLQWWAMFLSEWNGVRMMTQLSKARPNASIISDASGNWGCGAFCSSGKWFQIQWPDSWAPIHTTVKELLPIVVACAVWGGSLKNLTQTLQQLVQQMITLQGSQHNPPTHSSWMTEGRAQREGLASAQLLEMWTLQVGLPIGKRAGAGNVGQSSASYPLNTYNYIQYWITESHLR